MRATLKAAGVEALLVATQPDLRYLTGFTGSAGALAFRRGGLCLFTDGRYAEQARAEAKGVPVRIEKRSAALAATEWMHQHGVRRCGFDATTTTVAGLETLRMGLPGRDRRGFFVALSGPIARQREVKDAEEIAVMRRAAAIGDEMFAIMLHRLEPGRSEQEMADVLASEARRLGAEGMSFETIVASGERSAMPHGRASGAKLPKRGFVTLDFGVIFGGYCSDMTRTVSLGRPDPEHADVYHSVLEAQKKALDAVAPGVSASTVDSAARGVLERDGLAEYFTHSTGHGLGMEVHEGPRIAARQEQVLTRGMIITIEPGVYVSGRFGVRIEDMVLLSNSGGEVLTHSTKALIEL